MELLQVITSHNYPRIYFCLRSLVSSIKESSPNKLNPVHFYPLRITIEDFKKLLSNKKVSFLTKWAMPYDINARFICH